LIRAQEEKNQIKNRLLVQDMDHKIDLMLVGMITEDLGTQEVLVDIIIQLDIYQGENMHFMNQRVIQACIMSSIKGEGLS